MDFFTQVGIPAADFEIDYRSNLMFVGSCFADNISRQWADRKFHVLSNPFGTIYNPLSIAEMFARIVKYGNSQGKAEGQMPQAAPSAPFTEGDVFFDGEKWCCWNAHSFVSGDQSREAFIEKLSQIASDSYDFLKKADVIFITLGTAFVYFLKESGKVVANCHRQRADLFERRMISVEEAASALRKNITTLRAINPSIRIVFTVSPLRHLSDGAHENNLSKSTLLLAVENVCKECSTCYFPSYEIVMDELRDYRFYAEDMIHLSAIAEKYIFERMCETYCASDTRNNMQRVEKFMKTANHKIVNPDSEKTTMMAEQQIHLAEEMEKQIPGLNLSCEKEHFQKEISKHVRDI